MASVFKTDPFKQFGKSSDSKAAKLSDRTTFQVPISEKLAADYWQWAKCTFLAEQIAEIRQQMMQIAKKELDKTATVQFSRSEIEIQWNGYQKIIPKPEQQPREIFPYRFRSRINPFMPAKGEELAHLIALSEAVRSTSRSMMPVQTKRTCEVWAQARSQGLDRPATLLEEEARRCLSWEWPTASLDASALAVEVVDGSLRISWTWEKLLQDAQA